MNPNSFKQKYMLSDKASVDNLRKPQKASSEINFYVQDKSRDQAYNRRLPLTGPGFRNLPPYPDQTKFQGIRTPNVNLIPKLMSMETPDDPNNFNVGHLNDRRNFKKISRMSHNMEMIKSPKSEVNNYFLKPMNRRYQNQRNNDFKDNISNQEVLSRNARGNTSQNNVFYQNSSNNIPSINISDKNLKSSIWSFKDNYNDPGNYSTNIKNEESLKMLQNFPDQANSQFNGLRFTGNFRMNNEPNFHLLADPPSPLLDIHNLVNLKQMKFDNSKSNRQINSPQIKLNKTSFIPIFPKKGIRPSINSHTDDLIIKKPSDLDEKNRKALCSVDRETQILPGYNYFPGNNNFEMLFRRSSQITRSKFRNIIKNFDIQEVRIFSTINFISLDMPI